LYLFGLVGIQVSEDSEDDEFILRYSHEIDSRWVCFRLDGLANLIIMITSSLAVLYKGTQNSGVLSLSITYALQVRKRTDGIF